MVTFYYPFGKMKLNLKTVYFINEVDENQVKDLSNFNSLDEFTLVLGGLSTELALSISRIESASNQCAMKLKKNDIEN